MENVKRSCPFLGSGLVPVKVSVLRLYKDRQFSFNILIKSIPTINQITPTIIPIRRYFHNLLIFILIF